MFRGIEKPTSDLRWVLAFGLWDEPSDRHLYGVDHHHCAANAVVLLIEEVFLLVEDLTVNPRRSR